MIDAQTTIALWLPDPQSLSPEPLSPSLSVPYSLSFCLQFPIPYWLLAIPCIITPHPPMPPDPTPPILRDSTPHAVLRNCESVKLWSLCNQRLAATVSQFHSFRFPALRR